MVKEPMDLEGSLDVIYPVARNILEENRPVDTLS